MTQEQSQKYLINLVRAYMRDQYAQDKTSNPASEELVEAKSLVEGFAKWVDGLRDADREAQIREAKHRTSIRH